jgi:hypothetical protein
MSLFVGLGESATTSRKSNLACATSRKLSLGASALAVLIVGCLGALLWLSIHLASTRIYQVDECQNLYTARVLTTGQSGSFFTSVSPFLALLGWLTRGAEYSGAIFLSARLFMLEIFWLNIALIALATGNRLVSFRGLTALAGAATLAPLWDYGFEVRHDNLILTCLLLTWCVVRVHPRGVQSYLIAGALAVLMQSLAFKAIVYVVPLSLVILMFPPPAHRVARRKLVLAWLGGAVGILLAIRLAYGAAGVWDLFLSDLRRVSGAAAGGSRFGPWDTLGRLFGQTPLLLAMTSSAIIVLCWPVVSELATERRQSIWRRLDRLREALVGGTPLSWEGNCPEVFLLAVGLLALVANPTPFPYNLLQVVPFAFLVAFRHGLELWQQSRQHPQFTPAIAAILIFAHFTPFVLATRRHLIWTNARQESLASLAEDLTHPAKDPVYDGVGLVPTRRSIHFRWLLHSLNIHEFTAGPGPALREMLAAQPAAVLIPNYRTDWLPDEDHDFIRQHYVALGDDFWVLGKVLPPGGGVFEAIHAGRYRVAYLRDSDLCGTYPEDFMGFYSRPTPASLEGTLDGTALSDQPIELTIGVHQIDTTPDAQLAIFWVGPDRERLLRIGRGNHRTLYRNWY